MRLRLPQISFPLLAPRGQPLCSTHSPTQHRSCCGCTSCLPAPPFTPQNLLSDPWKRDSSVQLHDFWQYSPVHHIALDSELLNLSACPCFPITRGLVQLPLFISTCCSRKASCQAALPVCCRLSNSEHTLGNNASFHNGFTP